MPSKRILLVDDQRHDSECLAELINLLGADWQPEIVGTGAEALARLDQEAFDVVVSELILPDMNADALHKQISEKHPGPMRFILSDHSDRELMLKAAAHVHQFVAKPCDAERFRKVLNNSLGLRQLLANKELHQRIATIRSLPSPPAIYNELVLELQSEHANLRKIANLIEKDVAITAKLLQMINSAFFGLPAHVESPFHAVNLLGLETVQSLVLTAGVFNQFQDPKIPGLSLDSIHQRSIAVGTSAKHLSNAFGLQRREVDDAFMAGMLHDVGKLVMMTNFKEELRQAIALAETESIPLHQAEERVLGVGDTQIGAHLLSLWGLPDSILEAVALHHSPERVPSPMLNVLTAVHLAYAIDHDTYHQVHDPRLSAINTPYLEQLGLAQELPNLRRFCVTGAG